MAPTTRSKLKRQERELEAELLRCAENVTGFDRVRELVEVERVNVNCADGWGRTPLFVAAINGHFIIARLLLENRADVDAASNSGCTSLWYAVYSGRVAMAELLLQHGANINKECRYYGLHGHRFSLLGLAIYKRSVAMVALLLRFGANTEQTLYKGGTHTAFYLACWWNDDMEIVRLLLDHDDGVDVNASVPRDHEYRGDPAMSLLCRACRRGNMEMAQVLVQHGARVIFDGVYPDVPCPLVEAVHRRSLEVVRFLLDHSRFSEPVDGNARLPQHEIMGEHDTAGTHHPLSPPLGVAIMRNQPQVAQLLVDRGANVNDKPFLWQCAKFQHDQPRLEIARLLVRAGANVNLADGESGETPLWAAAEEGNVELVKMLLKARADVRIRDVNGETPLGVAYRRGHKDIVYLLLRTSPHVWPKLRSFVSGVSH